jgi:hypothetical protein
MLCRAVACRYIVSQPTSISAKFITDTLKATWPAAAAALPDGKDAPDSHINSSRVERDLGLEYTPVGHTIRDMAESLLKCGIAKPSWWHSSLPS